MEAALEKVGADVLILDEDSGQIVYEATKEESNRTKLGLVGSKYLSINKLAQTLKMGPITQLVVSNNSSTELCTRHDENTVAIVSSIDLYHAVVADSLVDQLF